MYNLELNNKYFHIKNKVYNNKFDINKEIIRYKLIKKYIDDEYIPLIYFALCFEKPKNDPFLIKIKLNNKIGHPYTTEFLNDNYELIKKYNILVKYIVNKLNKISNYNRNISYKINYKYENNILNIEYEDIKFKSYLHTYKEKYNERYFCAFLRYHILKFDNNLSTAVCPEIYEKYKKKDYYIELFGSFFNHYLPYYFGLFYDLEHPFGCLGNLYSSELVRGNFVANPPFNNMIMNTFFLHIKKNMNHKIKIFITIPLWYIPYRKIFNKTAKKKLINDYKNDLYIDIIKPFIKYKKFYSKDEYFFYNYLQNKKMNITPVVEISI